MDLNSIPLPYLRGSVKLNKDITMKYPNGYFKPKKCRYCTKIFTPIAPSHHYCNEECSIKASADSYLYRNFKISLETYFKMYINQKGKCAICNNQGFSLKEENKVTLVVDHSHLTGEVRGLLCHNCNRALGLFKDNVNFLQKAQDYLKHSRYSDTNTIIQRNRIKRTKINKENLSKDTIFSIYNDVFINKLRTKEICDKYNITRNTKTNIQLGKVYKEYFQQFKESSTTIL